MVNARDIAGNAEEGYCWAPVCVCFSFPPLTPSPSPLPPRSPLPLPIFPKIAPYLLQLLTPRSSHLELFPFIAQTQQCLISPRQIPQQVFIEITSYGNMASPAKKTKLNQTAAKKPCPYGAACYRKNPAHFVEFSHPNDANPSDTGTCSTSVVAKDRATKVTAPATQTSSLPPCKYGAHCYRKNLMHFAEYSHPTVPSSSQDLTADSDSGDTDVCESDDDKV